jgi:hypothetical protein
LPAISTRFVRASLIYLALGFTLGALMLVNKALAFSPLTWRLLPIHIETLLIGWFVQLALGVAFWILPRLPGPAPRGHLPLVWISFGLINLGIGLVILEVITAREALLLAGRLAELGGALAFIAGSWNRVKAFNRKTA